MNEVEATRRRNIWRGALDVLNDLQVHTYDEVAAGLEWSFWMGRGVNMLIGAGYLERIADNSVKSHFKLRALVTIPVTDKMLRCVLRPDSADAMASMPRPETIETTSEAHAEPEPEPEPAEPGPPPSTEEMLTALVNALPLMIDAISRIETKVNRIYKDLIGVSGVGK